jgi:hypothetical protein
MNTEPITAQKAWYEETAGAVADNDWIRRSALVTAESTKSTAVFEHRRTGSVREISLYRDHFPEPFQKRAEILRQLSIDTRARRQMS